MALAFDLPEEREAHAPPERRGLARDAVRLLVTDEARSTHSLTRFDAFATFLQRGDLVVVNDSATLPAALEAVANDGSRAMLHLSTRISSRLWIVEPRRTRVHSGDRFGLPAGAVVKVLRAVDASHPRLWYARLDLPQPIERYLAAHGRPIAYDYLDACWPIAMYQTIFARVPGSVEMPSAGRPFSLRTLAALRMRGINMAIVTLHCGVASPETHEPPIDERFEVPEATVTAVDATHARGRRVVAIGTTVVRALETVGAQGPLRSARGWTSHIVDDLHPPKVVDALLTGFHEPRASHLQMLAAFVPAGVLAAAYAEALRQRLLWHEFGDVHLILPARNLPRSRSG